MEDELSPGPVTSRRWLTAELRQLRESRQITQDEAAHALEWSVSKLVRIEGGRTRISATDLRALLRLYEVTDRATTNRLAEWARTARTQEWWRTNTPSEVASIYIGLESEASAIYTYEAAIVPGLLQTESYARLLLQIVTRQDSATREQRVKLRTRRQQHIFDRVPPAPLAYVIDEAALRRTLGSATHMRDQLIHLIRVANRNEVSLQVLPFSAGMHPGTPGSFSILDFGIGDSVVYLESYTDAFVMERPQEVSMHRNVFEQLRTLALNTQESVNFIENLADSFSD